MSIRGTCTLAFDKFILDPARGCVLDGADEIARRPKSFALLQFLIANGDRLVTKDEIAKAIWPDTTATDESIAQCISDIRLALRDTSRTIVKTAPRRGYLFAATASVVHEEPESLSVWPLIAVLPFGGTPDLESFCNGFADDLAIELSRVWPHVASVRPRDRRPTQTHFTVRGMIRRTPDRLWVNVHPQGLGTNTSIWSRRYSLPADDAVAAQIELASLAASDIGPALYRAEQNRAMHKQPEALGAYDIYQRGLWHLSAFNQADLEAGIALFRQAISLDPIFAAPYGGLAQAFVIRATRFSTRPLRDGAGPAKEWASKALNLDSREANAEAALAIATLLAGDRQEALDQTTRMVASNDISAIANSSHGAMLISHGCPAEGRRYLLRALALNPHVPRQPIIGSQLACSYYFEGDYSGAIKAAQRAIATQPGHNVPRYWLAAAQAQLGVPEASTTLRDAIAASSRGFQHYVRNGAVIWRNEDHHHFIDGLRRAGLRG